MGIIETPGVPLDSRGNGNGNVDENGNRCDGNGMTIYTITFPLLSLYFQFSVFMHLRQTALKTKI